MKIGVKRVARASTLLLGLTLFSACSPEEASDEPQQAGNEAAAPAQLDRPRVVMLVSLDTLRADHLGTYGYERFTSPVLDSLARDGVVFEDASATSPWTLPSHASMLTGLYPLEHGVVSMKTVLSERVPTLASVLGAAGFETAAVVNSTWLKRESYGLTRAFEKYLFVEDVAARRSPNTWVTDQALEWLAEADKAPETPLFLFVHYYDAHSDYVSEPAYERLFVGPYDGEVDGSGWQLTRANLDEDYLAMCREDFQAEKCTFGSAEKPWVVDASVSKLHLEPGDVRHLIDLYDAGVRQLDTELGRLFAGLRTLGLEDETLLLVTSDHGEEFMEHGRVDHFLPTWQEVLRVPLIVRGPGVPAGARVRAPVSLVDIAPTVLARVGVRSSRPLDGRDLSPLFGAEPGRSFEERLLYGEASGGLTYDLVVRGYFPVFRSVRQGRYKLVYESKSGTHSLYDLETDPGEQRDVSAEYPEIAEALIQEMRARYANFTPDAPDGGEAVLSDEETERLRELGYLR